jgi:hypothetical protein
VDDRRHISWALGLNQILAQRVARLDRDRSNSTDALDTGEHVTGALDNEHDGLAQISASRLTDLAVQIDFLDREVTRYRGLVEHERIRHSTELADLQLDADTKLDEMRSEERQHSQSLHDSYRSLLSERQVEFEQLLSAASAANATDLTDERHRHYEILEHEHTRRDVMLEASRKQTVDEINELDQRARQTLETELAQASSAIDRLQAEVNSQLQRADQAEAKAANAHALTSALKRQVDRLESQQQLRSDEADKHVATATNRLLAERQRSAASLADLLEHSASIAAEADKARSDFAAEHARAEQVAVSADHQARVRYQALADAADDRATRAIQRETELEALIAELRENRSHSG